MQKAGVVDWGSSRFWVKKGCDNVWAVFLS